MPKQPTLNNRDRTSTVQIENKVLHCLSRAGCWCWDYLGTHASPLHTRIYNMFKYKQHNIFACMVISRSSAFVRFTNSLPPTEPS